MVYIHKKKIGNVTYYTLRISVREGNKVIAKDLANLGNDLSKIKIEELEKKYSKEIRKSYKNIKKFLESNRYLEIAKKQKLKLQKLLSKDQIVQLKKNLNR